jgi:hypothetical protein
MMVVLALDHGCSLNGSRQRRKLVLSVEERAKHPLKAR